MFLKNEIHDLKPQKQKINRVVPFRTKLQNQRPVASLQHANCLLEKKKRKNVTADPLLNSVLGEFCSCSTDAEMDVEPGAHASPRHRHRSMASRPWIIPARRSGGS
jgi:hypothetical protein